MLLSFLSAFLFYLAFPNRISMYGFWPCIWIFAVPLLWALRDQPLKSRLGYGLFWGLCAYGLMAQGLIRISPAGFLAFILSLSIQPVIFAFLYRPTGRSWTDILYFSALWSASECARNSLLGGFSFYISHAQAFCPALLKLYGIFGCLGMTFIIMLVNSLIFSAIMYKQYRSYLALCAVTLFLSVVGAGALIKGPALHTARLVRVAVIQADISPLEKMDLSLFDRNASLHLELSRQAYAQAHPDLIIWPETAFPDDLLQSDEWKGRIFAGARQMNTDLLTGIAPIIDGKEYNSALLISARGQFAGLYNKQALVPFSETTPLEPWGIRWGRGYHFSSGNKPGIFTLSRGSSRFGVVICSESANPFLVRQLRKAGARFLVEISNDGWFSDKASCMLHAQAAVMRAVENRIWVIRAANTGFSFAVDPDGVIHTDGNLKLGHKGFGIFDIMIREPS
jgi:apolipoprotein N-acyltransferase